LIRDLEKDIKKYKYKSKLFIITGDFYLRDEQISNIIETDYTLK
jgi:hypothetical protein